MIGILGDIHSEWIVLHKIVERSIFSFNDTLIQVGDFGVYPTTLKTLRAQFPDGFPCKVLIVDGNHENFDIINQWSKEEPTEFHKNFFYVPRGYVTTIENELFGFLGGGESIDKAWRTPGYDWFMEERIQAEDVEKLIQNVKNRKLDVLITHASPEFVNRIHFSKLREEDWQLPLGWIDESAVRINKIHSVIHPKKHYCGHMHRSITHGNVRIVDINELIEHNPLT